MKSKRSLLLMVAAVFVLGTVVNAGVIGTCTTAKYNAHGTSWGSGTDYLMAGKYATTGYEITASAVMQFDISGITEPVTEAYLQIESYMGSSTMFGIASETNPVTISVRLASSDVSTWDTFQSSEVGDTVYDLEVISSAGYYYIDVTDIVNYWLTNGNTGLVLVGESADSGNSFAYIYGLGNSAGDAPVLTTVPEPMTLAMFGLGSLLLRKRS